jgi:hypothetical protein
MFNSISFGPNGHKVSPPGKVIENFTRREANLDCLTKYIANTNVF